MNARNTILAVFLIAVVVVVGATVFGRKDPSEAAPEAGPSKATTSITMLYSTEKKDWVQSASVGFAKLHPEITLVLEGIGSMDGVNAILEGQKKPTIFSPADSVALNLLAADWETRFHTPLVATTGADAARALVITPLVFAVWEDRANALIAKEGAVTWKTLHAAVTAKQGWPAVGGKAEWGFVKLGQTDPTRSNSGLQALILMAMEYFGRTSLTVADVLDPGFQTFLSETQRGVTRFEPSTGTFMTDMVRFGPSKYDIAVVYESLAIGQIANAQGRWGNLKVYYPTTTLWSDHPAAVLQGDWVTEEQRVAGRLWVDYLLSTEVQGTALNYGFRPADLSIPIKSADTQNPFNRLASFGIQVDVGTAASAPDGPVIQNLLLLWQRQVKK